MGNYNSEYESYYNSLKNTGRATYSPSYNNKSFSGLKGIGGSHLGKRIIRELSGVLILFIFVIGCRVIVTPETQAVYKSSKEILNENYDYKSLEKKIRTIDLKNLQDNIINAIEQLKSKITGKETKKW